MRMRALAITALLAIVSVPLPAGAEEQFKDSELRAAKALEAIRGDTLALYAFLKRMPKGADLHNHLDGAVYAETFIRVGGEDGLCVDPVAKSFTKSQPIRSGAEPEPVWEEGDVGVEGKTHPFATYRKLGVPVALSTDDEGVSRIDLTHEYVSAVEDFGLTYAELKELVRNSLEYSFLPGSSLWDDKGAYLRVVPDCQADAPRPDPPSAACATFLRASEKAQQQWELERRFKSFEASL